MTDQAQSKWQKLNKTAKNKARLYREEHKTSQSDIPLGILSFAFAAAAGVGGAIAFPVLYATNFGIGLTLAFTGAACGAVTGFTIPQAIHKAVSTTSFQYLKPSTYREAFKPQTTKPKTP